MYTCINGSFTISLTPLTPSVTIWIVHVLSFTPKMCLQGPNGLPDNLENRLETVDFVDSDQDTCDYIDLTDNEPWHCNTSDLLVLQLNIRGLLNKQGDLLNLVNRVAGRNKIDVLILQETWLTSSNCHLICLPGYKHIYNYQRG